MKVAFTATAKRDLQRLYNFLADSNPSAAAKAVVALTMALEPLERFPAIGEMVEEYAPREVRRWLILGYELHYEVKRGAIYITNIWHQREDRPSITH